MFQNSENVRQGEIYKKFHKLFTKEEYINLF